MSTTETNGRVNGSAAVDGPIEIGTDGVRFDEVIAVARHEAPVRVSDAARAEMERSRAHLDRMASSPDAHYGVSTGFGSMANRFIEPEDRRRMQLGLVRSHAAGMGEPIERECVRAMMFLRLRSLCSGRTGVRPRVAEAMADLLNHGITPVVPEFGSVGCSGDLSPLAHVAMALVGEGTVEHRGDVVAAGDVLQAEGLEPIELQEKEGLALINGTDGMLGMLVMACADAHMLLQTADVVGAMSVEGLLGTDRAFAADLMDLRPQIGQADSAANLVRLMADSGIVASHREDDPRVQDAYSLRCSPQVHGAARDTLAHAIDIAERELRSAIDNPVVLADGRVESNGNFHGIPLGFAADFLAIAMAEVGSVSERRMDRHLDETRSHGLPPFLAGQPGVDSGLMIGHYTAAAIVAENRRLAGPASVDSIPTSAMQEDHVSMGWGAVRKLRSLLDNVARILAIEAVIAARSCEIRSPLEPAPASRRAIATLREAGVDGPGADRFLSPELGAAYETVRSGLLAATVAEVVGELA